MATYRKVYTKTGVRYEKKTSSGTYKPVSVVTAKYGRVSKSGIDLRSSSKIKTDEKKAQEETKKLIDIKESQLKSLKPSSLPAQTLKSDIAKLKGLPSKKPYELYSVQRFEKDGVSIAPSLSKPSSFFKTSAQAQGQSIFKGTVKIPEKEVIKKGFRVYDVEKKVSRSSNFRDVLNLKSSLQKMSTNEKKDMKEQTLKQLLTDKTNKLVYVNPIDKSVLGVIKRTPQITSKELLETVPLSGVKAFILSQPSKNRVEINNKISRLPNRILNKINNYIIKFKDINKARKEISKNINVKLETLKELNFKKIESLQKDTAKLKQYFPDDKIKIIKKEVATYTIATIGLASIGGVRALKGLADAVTNPVAYVKGVIQTFKNPKKYIVSELKRAGTDPFGVLAEYYVFSKTAGAMGGKVTRNNPLARYVNREIFIRSQPKNLRTPVRKILNGIEVQRKLDIAKKSSITSADFMVVKTLTKIEAKALFNVIKKDPNTVIFGSFSQYIRSDKKTSMPKDIDLATKNISSFSKKFINELPKEKRTGYKLKGEKIVRGDGSMLFDLKPLSRILPARNLLGKVFGSKGKLPITTIRKKISFEKGRIKLKDTIKTSKYAIRTSKITKISGIKFIGFGEQTVRKGLGTLQVLIEKNVKRAKDPASLVNYMELQIKYLKEGKNIGLLGRISKKRKLRIMQDTLKLLKSKGFQKLLNEKVPELTKEFPLVSKISPKKLNNYFKKISKSKKVKIIKGKEISKYVTKEFIESYLPKSRVPKSRVPKSRVPKSRVPKSKVPKSRVPKSRVPKSRVPKSKVPKSKVPKSKVPKSKVPKSKVPKSKVPKSKVPKSRLSKLPFSSISALPYFKPYIIPVPNKFTPKKVKEEMKKRLIKIPFKRFIKPLTYICMLQT